MWDEGIHSAEVKLQLPGLSTQWLNTLDADRRPLDHQSLIAGRCSRKACETHVANVLVRKLKNSANSKLRYTDSKLKYKLA